MIRHTEIDNSKLHGLLKAKKIRFAGNLRWKIYGTLECRSGKRLKKANRVFFKDEQEALSAGFRPCGHCMKLLFESRGDSQK